MNDKPTFSRLMELIELIELEIEDNMRSLSDYHDWDDLIEVDEEMTYEEWEYMSSHYTVKLSASLVKKSC